MVASKYAIPSGPLFISEGYSFSAKKVQRFKEQQWLERLQT